MASWLSTSSSSHHHDGSSKKMTKTTTLRIIYFKGHRDEENSALITQVCADYETVTGLLHGESATRTLLNLYNLHAARGILDMPHQRRVLRFQSSMSGPHHYFGWIDPRKHTTIMFNDRGLPIYIQYDHDQHLPPPTPPPPQQQPEAIAAAAAADHQPQPQPPQQKQQQQQPLRQVQDEELIRIENYQWIKGTAVDPETRKQYSIHDDVAVHLVDTDSGNADSLFDDPGILLLDSEEQLLFPVIRDAHLCDLSSFRAKVVPNHVPFAFDQQLVSSHKHAQHKLRVVTYNYADRYLEDYLMHGSGVFIERHEFIQAITPANPQCGGFVMLGREVRPGASASSTPRLEMIGVAVPFGYTILVDVGAIHGDSTLTGFYSMAMTGNHHAMRTADTVFLKHRSKCTNVFVGSSSSSSSSSSNSNGDAPPRVAGLRGDRFLLTSDEKPLANLKADNRELKRQIKESLGALRAAFWLPVIATGTSSIGWPKTLGLSLPKSGE